MARRTLKQYIQEYLGIYAIHDSIANMRNHFLFETQRREDQIRPLLNGVGRIIAKHDALYAQSENPLDNPNRKAASDKLGDEVIKRLRDEDAARCDTLGES